MNGEKVLRNKPPLSIVLRTESPPFRLALYYWTMKFHSFLLLIISPNVKTQSGAPDTAWPRRCFEKLQDSQLDYEKFFPVIQMDGISLDRCLALCAEEFECSSVHYVPGHKRCALFTVTSSGGTMIACPGVDHYDITRPCETVPTSSCGTRKAPFYIQRKNSILPGSGPDSTRLKGISEKGCRDDCDRNLFGNMPVQCRGFSYDRDTRDCVLYTEPPAPFGRMELGFAQGMDTSVKLCLNDEMRPCSLGGVGEWSPGMILSGHAIVVLTAPDIETCMEECGSSVEVYAFQCNLITYFYDDQECILNEATKYGFPGQWVEAEKQVHSIHIKCDPIVNPFQPSAKLSQILEPSLRSRLRQRYRRPHSNRNRDIKTRMHHKSSMAELHASGLHDLGREKLRTSIMRRNITAHRRTTSPNPVSAHYYEIPKSRLHRKKISEVEDELKYLKENLLPGTNRERKNSSSPRIAYGSQITDLLTNGENESTVQAEKPNKWSNWTKCVVGKQYRKRVCKHPCQNRRDSFQKRICNTSISDNRNSREEVFKIFE